MKLIHRVCPICTSVDYEEVVNLRQIDFTVTNSTYRLDRLDELGLDPEQSYPIVKCRQCGMTYTLYHLDDETEALVYNRVIDSTVSIEKVQTVSRRIKDLKSWMDMLSLIEKHKPGKLDLKIMDYGCGWGTLLLTAQGPGVQVVGFDVTGWKITWAREQGLPVCTSVQQLKSYAPFDIVVSTSVLEHMQSPRKAMEEMVSMLKPGGYALITCIVPAALGDADWKEIKRRLSRGLPLHKEINPWEHLNYFTVETLSRLLSEYGLVPLKTQNQSDYLERSIQSVRTLRKHFRYMLAKLSNSDQGRVLPAHDIPEYWQLKRTIKSSQQ